MRKGVAKSAIFSLLIVGSLLITAAATSKHTTGASSPSSALATDPCTTTFRTEAIYLDNQTDGYIEVAFLQGIARKTPPGYTPQTGVYAGCQGSPAHTPCYTDPCRAPAAVHQPCAAAILKGSVKLVFPNGSAFVRNLPDHIAPDGQFFHVGGWKLTQSAALSGSGAPTINVVPIHILRDEKSLRGLGRPKLPIIDTIVPSSVPLNSKEKIVLNGRNFGADSAVIADGYFLNTTYISENRLEAVLTTDVTAKAGKKSVKTHDLETGDLSNEVILTVNPK